jgi:hypothetical protein
LSVVVEMLEAISDLMRLLQSLKSGKIGYEAQGHFLALLGEGFGGCREAEFYGKTRAATNVAATRLAATDFITISPRLL